MCTFQIFMQSYDKFIEIDLAEKENAELFVEEVIGHVLLNLFGGGIVEDVTVQFSAGLPMGLHHCSISISAQCACEGFVLFPRSSEHMKRAIEQSISSIFKELFVTVKFDNILLRPSQWACQRDTELSYNVPTQFI